MRYLVGVITVREGTVGLEIVYVWQGFATKTRVITHPGTIVAPAGSGSQSTSVTEARHHATPSHSL